MRQKNTARGYRALAALAVLAGVWLLIASRIHVNASWSDDAWGYFVLPARTLARGDRVVFDPPETVGAEVPYLKTVRGVPGDAVTVDGNRGVWVGGECLGRAKPHALDGRKLDAIASGLIPEGHYFVHADHTDSHDSRYAEIGFVPRDRIVGRATALPDIPWLGLEGPLVGPCGQQARGRPVCVKEASQ